MINSLFKDSHITQSFSHSKFYSEDNANSRTRQKYNYATLNNSMNKSIKKPAEPSFSGLSSANKKFDVYTNKRVKDFLILAADKQPVFNAAFSLLLTCLLRPASIMVLPSDKKNKDDKKYAAAHSIASGIIGYAISVIIFSPIGDAMKKIMDKPDEFLKGDKLKYLRDEKKLKVAKSYVNLLPDTILSAPKAILTVALIPPILKYVFGWEKKKPAQKTVNPPQEIKGGIK